MSSDQSCRRNFSRSSPPRGEAEPADHLEVRALRPPRARPTCRRSGECSGEPWRRARRRRRARCRAVRNTAPRAAARKRAAAGRERRGSDRASACRSRSAAPAAQRADRGGRCRSRRSRRRFRPLGDLAGFRQPCRREVLVRSVTIARTSGGWGASASSSCCWLDTWFPTRGPLPHRSHLNAMAKPRCRKGTRIVLKSRPRQVALTVLRRRGRAPSGGRRAQDLPFEAEPG